MTSFLIDSQIDRKVHKSWKEDAACAFCRIIREELPAYRVFEDEHVVAILDLMPLRSGHTLVIPKVHCANISDLSPEYASKTGETVSKVAKALTEVLDNPGLNVVANQVYAQAVGHVHYHVIPAPRLNEKPPTVKKDPPTRAMMHRMEFESREELDGDFAKELSAKIRAYLSPAMLSHL